MSVSGYEGWLLAGRYRLQDELGRGGMGRVWRGHDEVLDRPVAVKEVTLDRRPQSEREALLGRTMSEARLAARLSHPNVATIYDVVVADERPWIVLQLVPAPTLADVLATRGPLPPVSVARIGLQVLDALRAAHAAGIVHRDVKPANILLDGGESHAVLTDFGLATSLEKPVDLTIAGEVVGTPAYIAPERARGGPPTPQSDLWSLGVTLYAAVEGRSPFEQEGALATISAVLTAEPAPFERAGVLAPVIAGLLQKDPARRTRLIAARRQLERLLTLSGDDLPLTLATEATARAATGTATEVATRTAGEAAFGAVAGEFDRPSLPEPPKTGDHALAVTGGPAYAGNGWQAPAAKDGRADRGACRPAQARPAQACPAPARLTQTRRAQLRHVAVVSALIAGVLVASFWPDTPAAPPVAQARPQDRMSATPSPEPTPTAVSVTTAVLKARPVAVRRRARDHAGTPAAAAAREVAQPPGQGKKVTNPSGRTPPGHGAGHPGKGNAKGRP
ncbi:protein kinase domain-containing protein [[Actinomadura] parvosata]|uniref:protein kinase domain-containing protein n=1 Tax=[Actinomadura] parvosata TaxID=1955412 RepID=UPI00406C08D6